MAAYVFPRHQVARIMNASGSWRQLAYFHLGRYMEQAKSGAMSGSTQSAADYCLYAFMSIEYARSNPTFGNRDRNLRNRINVDALSIEASTMSIEDFRDAATIRNGMQRLRRHVAENFKAPRS